MQAWKQWMDWLSSLTGLPQKGLLAALVLIGGLLVAMVMRVLVALLVRRLGGLVAAGGPASPLGETMDRYNADTLFGRGAFWIIVLITLMSAAELLGFAAVSTWLGSVAAYLPRAVAAGIVLLGGVVLGAVLRGTLRRARPLYQTFNPEQVARAAQLGVIALAGLVALQQLGIKIGFLSNILLIVLAACLGAGALAFAIGSRSAIGNILASHYVRELYQVGQVVRIGKIQGRIVRFTKTAVLIETSEGEAAVPAKVILNTVSTRVTTEDES